MMEADGGLSSSSFSSLLIYAAVSRLSGFEMARMAYINSGLNASVEQFRERNEVLDIPSARMRDALSESSANEGLPGSLGIEPQSLDVVFSIGWINNLGDTQLESHVDACRSLLRPGGLFLHTFEFTIENKPSPYWRNRFSTLCALLDGVRYSPMAEVLKELVFSCDAASIADSDLFRRRKQAPALDALRMRSQTVGMIFAGRKL